MDGDRKYRQRGYMDNDRQSNGNRSEDRPKPSGPKPPIDITGPRLPRLLQTVAAARCFSCSGMLGAGTDFKGACPKCSASLHCCKQCAHFDTSTRFQCMKPILARVAIKDQSNECELFSPRVTVARDAAPIAQSAAAAVKAAPAPRTPQDARAAFDNLFKK